MRIAKTVCITLPPELLKKAQKIAAREHRTMSELIREALRHYLAAAQNAAAVRRDSGGSDDVRTPNTASGESGSIVVHSFRMEKASEK